MARFGADMIDAFTYGHLCQDDYANAKMRDEGFAMPDGSDPFQKEKPVEREELRIEGFELLFNGYASRHDLQLRKKEKEREKTERDYATLPAYQVYTCTYILYYSTVINALVVFNYYIHF